MKHKKNICAKHSPVRLEFSRNLFTILQNKQSKIDYKNYNPNLEKGEVRRKALRKKPTFHLMLLYVKHYL